MEGRKSPDLSKELRITLSPIITEDFSVDESPQCNLHKIEGNIEQLNGDFKLSNISKLMAQTLFLSNDNVKSVAKAYMNICTETCCSVITKTSILSQFVVGKQFVNMFFKDGRVSFNDYFQFVSLFLFFNTTDINSILLVLSNVYSNIFITKEQVMKFIEDYCLSLSFYFDLELVNGLSSNERKVNGNLFIMKEFMFACENNLEYLNNLHTFQQSLKKQTFIEYDYKSIIHRLLLKYYPASTKYTQETYFHKYFRRLFTKNSSPDEYDYGLDNPTTGSFNYVVYKLRKQFGYSNRSCLSTKTLYRHIKCE